MTVEIKLTRGYVAIVDDEDAHLARFRWHPQVSGRSVYAKRRAIVDGRVTTELLHRAIMRPGRGQEVDHRDCDGLNNRRSNLRLASRSENMRNSRRPSNNSSGFKGVYRHGNRWRARVAIGRSRFRSLGLFDTPEDAARAYDAAALEMYGEFARINGV